MNDLYNKKQNDRDFINMFLDCDVLWKNQDYLFISPAAKNARGKEVAVLARAIRNIKNKLLEKYTEKEISDSMVVTIHYRAPMKPEIVSKYIEEMKKGIHLDTLSYYKYNEEDKSELDKLAEEFDDFFEDIWG